MITAPQLIQKMGKEKFVNFVVNKKDREKTGAERDRGIKGRRRHRMCEHGVWVIEDYIQKPCDKCFEVAVESHTVVCHSHEYFNMGTGTYGTNSEHRKYAKVKGLVEAG